MTNIQGYQQNANLEFSNKPTFEEQLLAEGFELLDLNIKKDKVEAIMFERVHHYVQSANKVANSVLSLGKYPPAFGLMGTVLGLVELMKGVSAGMPAKETGTKMAIALVATMYGLLVANMFINPAGEQIKKIIKEEERMAEIAIQAVLLAAEGYNLIEAQEMLNSMVDMSDRVDFVALDQSFAEEEAA